MTSNPRSGKFSFNFFSRAVATPSQQVEFPTQSISTEQAEAVPDTLDGDTVEEIAQTQPKELSVELLKSSFEKIKPRAEEFVASFYENLFAAHPEVKPLFAHTDMEKQHKKLLHSLVLVVESLRNPEALGEVLKALGARHVGYGAIPVSYGPIGEALLTTFEQYLQQDWTPEVKQAWVTAYQLITTQMLKGAGIDNILKPVQSYTIVIPNKQVAAPTTQPQYQPKEVAQTQSKELPVELLESSFEKIKPRAEEFVASFYENLFAAHPEVKPLFAHTDMEKQHKKLLHSLVLVVESLRNPEALGEVLKALGARHVGYGAIPVSYGPIGEALLTTFEQYLQQDWTPEVKQAWVAAYKVITTQMLKGAGKESSPKVVRDEKAATIKEPLKLKAELLNESQQFQPQVEQQKKPLVSIQWNGEVLTAILSKITERYRQFQPSLSMQKGLSILKKISKKAINAFWTQPAWLIAVISAVLCTVIFVIADDNSVLADALEGADVVSLVVALVLFIKEAPDRKKQFHYQAWSTVDGAHGIRKSYARVIALQDLNQDGVSLRELDAPGAELGNIDIPNANLSEANLSEADLSHGNLSHANLDNANLIQAKLIGSNLNHAKLSFARLSQANLSSANLSNANLICADLSDANLSGANLKNASLSGANLKGAYLMGANLKGAKVSIAELSGALLDGAIMPDGSKHRSSKV
ncbi:MAG: globin domain-containing protein [Scytonema sp. PMC 1070.18]|nr:globin domain-containing protein [Scytonema sp. PMC 1070.18]